MTDQTGLREKYTVRRADGKDAPGGKHDGCRYFVLDLDHDPFAIPALRAYADACAEERPVLAEHLWEVAGAASRGAAAETAEARMRDSVERGEVKP